MIILWIFFPKSLLVLKVITIRQYQFSRNSLIIQPVIISQPRKLTF